MPIKAIPPREGKSPYWSGRGTHLGRYVDRSTKAPTKSLAKKVVRKWEREIERGEFAEPGEPTFASALIGYLNAGGDPRPTGKLLEYFKTTPLKKIDGDAIDACATALFPTQSPATGTGGLHARLCDPEARRLRLQSQPTEGSRARSSQIGSGLSRHFGYSRPRRGSTRSLKSCSSSTAIPDAG